MAQKFVVTSHRAGYLPDEGPDWTADTAAEAWQAVLEDHSISQDEIDGDPETDPETFGDLLKWAKANSAIETMIGLDKPGSVFYDDGRALNWVYEVMEAE